MAAHNLQEDHDESKMDEIEKIPQDKDQSSEDHPTSSVEYMASSLSKLFQVDPAIQLRGLEEVVDNLLLYYGECCSATDKTREESNKLLFISMPQFYEKRAAMLKLFKQIDALEEFITAIKSNVDEIEQSVQIAEKQLGSKNIKKIISSIPIPNFLSQKKQVQSFTNTDMKNLEPQIPTIFKTDNFLSCDGVCPENSRDLSSSEISDFPS